MTEKLWRILTWQYFSILIAFILLILIMTFLVWNRERGRQECGQYADLAVQEVPAKCLWYYR